MDTPLNEILNEQQAEQPAQTEAVAETPPQRERDEHGRFKAKETGETEVTETTETSAPPAQEQERVPITALHDERTKRQQLEAKLSQYEQWFAQQNHPPQQPTEAPDVFLDPEGHQAFVIEQAVQKALEKLTPAIQHGQTMSRAEVSEMLARQKFEDYDPTIEVFKEALQANPFLMQQLQQAPDPATFAYNAGKQYAAAKEYGGAVPTREQIRQELLEEVKAEVLGHSRQQVPTTLAGDRSVGSRSGPASSSATLRDILNT